MRFTDRDVLVALFAVTTAVGIELAEVAHRGLSISILAGVLFFFYKIGRPQD